MTLRASDIMTREPVTAGPDMTIAAAARRLTDAGISAMPVCAADGTPIGMVSEGDLLRPFHAANAQRRAWWLELLAEGEALGPDFVDHVRLDRRRVGDVMTRSVISVAPDTACPVIAELLERHRIKRVPVVEGGKLVGIVSRADLVRALAHAPGTMEMQA